MYLRIFIAFLFLRSISVLGQTGLPNNKIYKEIFVGPESVWGMAQDKRDILFIGLVQWRSIAVKRSFSHRSGAKGNSSQISQVMIKILDNSIYEALRTSREKILTIDTMETEEVVIIKIKDNGTGTPLHLQNHVFEPFYTTKEVGSGTGLRLLICYSIIKKHNGKISFVSSEDQGTEFTIALPKVNLCKFDYFHSLNNKSL